MQQPLRGLGYLAGAAVLYAASRRMIRVVRAHSSRRHPAFVLRPSGDGEIGVPVFTYHSVANPSTPDSVTPAEFERHMRYLAENGYTALTADEMHGYLVYGQPVPPRSVVITFDDGRATLWTAAFPILKKYGMKTICFAVPSFMDETGVRPTTADASPGPGVPSGDPADADLSAQPAITWEEARIMHDSGLVDFQSHTFHHTLIATGPQIVDFVHPGFRFEYKNVGVPVMRCGGEDRYQSAPPPGTPLYQSGPRFGAARRFFDDEGLRAACVEFVAEHDRGMFFARPDWRDELRGFADHYRSEHKLDERIETPAEQEAAIRRSLERTKQAIERHLPGHTVRHICYPWHRYSLLAASLARDTGHLSAFIDVNPQKLLPNWNDPYAIQRLIPINEPGDDPYQITRIDARGDPVLSLPGEGRLTLTRRLASRLLRLPGFLRMD